MTDVPFHMFMVFLFVVVPSSVAYVAVRRIAQRDAEFAMEHGLREQMRALLAMRGHLLTKEQRSECVAWLAEKDTERLVGR